MNKIGKIFAPLLVSLFVLTGCSQSESFQSVTVDKPASWDTNVSDMLKKDGWNVSISPTEEQKKQVKDSPTMFRAAQTENKCIITYASEPLIPKNFKSGDKFNTETFMLDKVSLASLAISRQIEFETMEVKVKNSSQKVSMLYTQYVEPYYGNSQTLDGQNSTNTKSGTSKPQGEIYSLMSSRNFSSSPIENPFYEVGKQYDANASKETTSVVYIQYQCLNKQLDQKIIDMIKNDSTLILN